MFDLKTFRKVNNLSQQDAAEYFDCTQSFISQIERKDRPIPDSFISKAKADKSMKFVGDENDFNSEEIYFIPLLPVSAQAGRLDEFTVQLKEGDLYERIVSPVKGADFAITVTGNSMEPEYPSGAKVFVKRINEKAFIEWGKVFVLDTVNGIVLKQIKPSEREGYIKCISINKDYDPFEVKMDGDVNGIYRVLIIMSLK